MKILFTALITLFTFSAAFAQGAVEKLDKIKTLQADFVQINTIAGFGEDKYTGKVYIVMKARALWDYIEPYSSWYLFTKKKIEQFDEVNNQLIRFQADTHTESLPLQVLMDFSIMKDQFIIEETKQGVKLTPKKDIGLTYMDITLTNGIINEIKSEDPTGNKILITFSNVVLDKKIPDSAFDKQLPKDVQIFEM